MFFEDNLKKLSQTQTDLYKACKEHEETNTEEEIFVEPAKNGTLIVGIVNEGQKVYLNSRYNPEVEAEKFLGEDVDAPDYSIMMMFGFANGSFLRSFLEKKKETVRVIVYEPSLELFLAVLHQINLTDILGNEDIYVIVHGLNDQELYHILPRMIEAHNIKTNKHIILPKYARMFREELSVFQGVLKENYETVTVTINTSKEYGARVCKNNFLNMRYMPGCKSGYDFVGKFPKDMPAILVAAGPSLEKNIDLLKTVKDKAFIIVVDTAMKKVFEHGIIPDMVSTIDFIKPLQLFEIDGLEEIPMLLDLDANYQILEKVNPKQVVIGSSDVYMIDQLFENVGSRMETISRGGSVATFTLANLIVWGFKTIIFVGQDLALTGNKAHAGEQASEIDMTDWRHSMIEGIDGNMVPTRKDFLMFIRWIEDVAFQYSDINFVDATEGGAKKKHTKIMTLQEAIDKYCSEEYDIKKVIDSVPRLFEDEHFDDIPLALQRIRSDMENMKKRMKEGVFLCEKCEMILHQKQWNQDELNNLVSKIGEIDEYILGQEVYMFLIKMIVEEDYSFADDMFIEEKDELKEAIRMVEKSRKYYQAIADAIPKTLEYVNEALMYLKGEK